jgi:sec-independent protein translocase protein TatA
MFIAIKKAENKNMSFGTPELLLIFGVITLFFGGRKIPELARGMGQAVREFRKSVKETREEVKAIELGGKGNLTNEQKNHKKNHKDGKTMEDGISSSFSHNTYY